jgi:hypothetical protein
MTYTEFEKAMLTREGEEPTQIRYSKTRDGYRKALDSVIRKWIIESLESENEDGEFTDTIEALRSGNKEVYNEHIKYLCTINFEELNIAVNF